MNETEEWRVIPSVPGLLASSHGRIWCEPVIVQMPRGGEATKHFKPWPGAWQRGTGQQGGRFSIFFRGKTYKVARLICEAFHGGPPNKRSVCMHLNEDTRDNRASNLAWGTQKENLNAPGFIAYCRKRVGDENPYVKGRKRRQHTSC